MSVTATLDAESLSRLDPEGGVAQGIVRQFSAYVDPATCRGARVLDFGCGVGSSTFALARLLPQSEIVGVELNGDQVRIANALRHDYGLTNLRFLASPAGDRLPADIGAFDFVMLSAVYEHLLPHERRVTLPLVWRVLKPGGLLFISGTPHRWFPKEHHTTGLWGLNYLPDGLTHQLAQRFGKLPRAGDWPIYLRAGIRGGTEGSMQRELGPTARIVPPRVGDRVGYWRRHLSPPHAAAKNALAIAFRLSDRVLGTFPATHVEVTFQKH